MTPEQLVEQIRVCAARICEAGDMDADSWQNFAEQRICDVVRGIVQRAERAEAALRKIADDRTTVTEKEDIATAALSPAPDAGGAA